MIFDQFSTIRIITDMHKIDFKHDIYCRLCFICTIKGCFWSLLKKVIHCYIFITSHNYRNVIIRLNKIRIFLPFDNFHVISKKCDYFFT